MHLQLIIEHLANTHVTELAGLTDQQRQHFRRQLTYWQVLLDQFEQSEPKSADAIIEEAREATLPHFRGGAGEHSQ